MLKLRSWGVCGQLFRKREFRISTVGQLTLVCTKSHPAGAHSGSQELPMEWCAQEACALETRVCDIQRSVAGEGGSCTYCCRSGAPLEVEVLGSMGLQVGQQDFGWSACRVVGSVQGLSGWWC